VYLSSDNTRKASVPTSVIIKKGQNSDLFDIKIIDDSISDGTKDVTITASVAGFSPGSAIISIADNDNYGWIIETFSSDLTCILRDDLRDRIYLADAGNSQLVVIDSQSLEVMLRLTLDSSFKDMAISKDHNTLAIAGGTIFLVNLETFETNKLATDLDVSSIAFDHNGDLMLMSSGEEGYIYHYDLDTEAIVKSFGTGSTLTNKIFRGFLKTDEDGNTLYVGDHWAPPATLCKIDISGNTPLFLAESNHGSVGDNMQDLVLSPKYNEIYIASGSPYGIQVVNSDTLNFAQLLETGAYL
jgi:DNA-binding beta-propeller fold protein YncE